MVMILQPQLTHWSLGPLVPSSPQPCSGTVVGHLRADHLASEGPEAHNLEISPDAAHDFVSTDVNLCKLAVLFQLLRVELSCPKSSNQMT